MKRLVITKSLKEGQCLKMWDLSDEDFEIPVVDMCNDSFVHSFRTEYLKSSSFKEFYLKCQISGIEIYTSSYRFRLGDKDLAKFIKDNVPYMDQKEAKSILDKLYEEFGSKMYEADLEMTVGNLKEELEFMRFRNQDLWKTIKDLRQQIAKLKGERDAYRGILDRIRDRLKK